MTRIERRSLNETAVMSNRRLFQCIVQTTRHALFANLWQFTLALLINIDVHYKGIMVQLKHFIFSLWVLELLRFSLIFIVIFGAAFWVRFVALWFPFFGLFPVFQLRTCVLTQRSLPLAKVTGSHFNELL